VDDGRATLDAALGRLAAIAEADPDREVCGFVLASAAAGPEIVEARNVAADPASEFRIAPGEVLTLLRRAGRSGARLVALFHSHPSGGSGLSARDHGALTSAGAPLLPGVELWVIGLRQGRATEACAHRWTGSAYVESARRLGPFTYR